MGNVGKRTKRKDKGQVFSDTHEWLPCSQQCWAILVVEYQLRPECQDEFAIYFASLGLGTG
jgi:hypothetical protein